MSSIKENLLVDDRDFADDGSINMNKGRVVKESGVKLQNETEDQYNELLSIISDPVSSASSYASHLSINIVRAYKLGIKARNIPNIDSVVKNLSENAVSLLTNNDAQKTTIRPLYCAIAEASNRDEILHNFDGAIFNNDLRDGSILLAVCINQGLS